MADYFLGDTYWPQTYPYWPTTYSYWPEGATATITPEEYEFTLYILQQQGETLYIVQQSSKTVYINQTEDFTLYS